MLFQIVSLAGAGMILAAYAASQLGRMNRQSALYLCLNLAGSTILTVSALRARSLGLTALEGPGRSSVSVP
jgi:hypothetical protein